MIKTNVNSFDSESCNKVKNFLEKSKNSGNRVTQFLNPAALKNMLTGQYVDEAHPVKLTERLSFS